MSAIDVKLVAQCLSSLRAQDRVTISDLAESTGLSRPTVTAALTALMDSGLVIEHEARGAAGRPARTFSPIAGSPIVVGLDLTRSTVRIVVADRTGRLLHRRDAEIAPPATARPSLAPVRSLLQQTIERIGRRPSDVVAIGVAVAGLIDEDGLLVSAPQVAEWSGKNLSTMFSDYFGAPVVVDNDLSLAAEAESRGGALSDAEAGVYALTWHHVSARVTAAGHVLRGRRGRAGEVGLLRAFSDVAVPQGPFLEAVSRIAAELSRLRDDPADSRGKAALEALSAAMTPAMAALLLTVDPDVIVLGGELGEFADLVAEPLAEGIRTAVTGIDAGPWVIRGGALGADAAALGALGLAFEKHSSRIYGFPGVPAPTLTTDLEHEEMTADTPADETTEFRAAVIGVGARAGVALHVKAAGGVVVAAVDPDPSTHERASRLFGDVPVFASVADLIASGIDVDGAFVTTPDFTHADVAVELLEAGIATYIEKPLAISIDDADRILETGYRTGTKVYVGHNMRHMQVVKMMKDIVDRGEIGEVKAIWCRHFVGHGGDYYFKDWHAERDKAMSLLLQKGAHDIDVMHWIAGTSTRSVVGVGDLAVYGDVESRRDNSDRRMGDWFSMSNYPPLAQQDLNPVIDVEDISMIMMRTDSGVLMSYQQCHFTPDYWRNYTVIGTEGRIENFDDDAGGEIRLWNARSDYLEKGHVRYPIEDGGDGGHGGADPLTVAEFVEFVRNGSATQTSPVAARDAVAAGVGGALSIRSGSQPFEIPALPEGLLNYYAAHQPTRH
ncbi:ROK family protein [Microbacterium sp. M28]|uniref:ROK family protein n=1 Tax=Microbacterium sp. M28 TaxID=2962064 RepID=UPI0029904123|nr:ROK family protein [Microbacterium sp. M28]